MFHVVFQPWLISVYMFQVVFQPPSVVRNDYVLVNIYPAHLQYQFRQMKAAYSILALLCDIGGALSLILGSTLLTFIEVLDFIVRLIVTAAV